MAPKVRLNSLGNTGTIAFTDNPAQQLKDPSLFKQNVCYVNGEWVKAQSGKTFEVNGM